MFDIDYLKLLLIISIVESTITCTFVQKTKVIFNSSKFITIYSFIINMLFSIIFCLSFTNITFPKSLWIGLFSYLGADTIYKSLEGKISSYSELINNNKIEIPKENIINKEDE